MLILLFKLLLFLCAVSGNKIVLNSSIVYIVDSGTIFANEFEYRILPGYSTIYGQKETIDCTGHGTHVSSIIAGKTYGISKTSYIVPVKIFNCDKISLFSNFAKAMTWILNSQYRFKKNKIKGVINLSLQGEYSTFMNNVVKLMVRNGFIVVASAGNRAKNSCDYSPSSLKSVITVGCVTSENKLCDFSSEGPCVDVYAPGKSIVGLAQDGKTVSISSGTSMSAAYVTGIMAKLLISFPKLTRAQLEKKLYKISEKNNITGFTMKNSINRLVKDQ